MFEWLGFRYYCSITSLLLQYNFVIIADAYKANTSAADKAMCNDK